MDVKGFHFPLIIDLKLSKTYFFWTDPKLTGVYYQYVPHKAVAEVSKIGKL